MDRINKMCIGFNPEKICYFRSGTESGCVVWWKRDRGKGSGLREEKGVLHLHF